MQVFHCGVNFTCTVRSCVRVITSDHPGMGKSFYIQQMAESLRATVGKTTAKYSIIPIHGPEVTSDTVMNFLNKYVEHPPCSMYHVDIASDVSAVQPSSSLCLLPCIYTCIQ